MKRTISTSLSQIPAILLKIAFCLSVFSFFSLSGRAQSSEGFTPKPYFVKGVSNSVISLNGTWDFNPAPPESFWKKTRISKLNWQPIEVPGEWAMQGYNVAPDSDAAYAKTIMIPKDWKGNRVMLKCDGVYSLARIYCNGKEIGRHEGGFTPFEFDLSKAVKFGKENTLLLSVQNESLADTLASATQYAAHQLGGISRKIEIFTVPETHLAWCHIETDLDESNQDAMLKVMLRLDNVWGKTITEPKISVSLSPLSFSGETISKSWSFSAMKKGDTHDKLLTLPVNKPVKWDPEHPELYQVNIVVKSDGEIIEKTSHTIGFREIVVAGNQVFVNGKPIKLRGVNRHEVHPTRGRSLSITEWRADAQLFKEANVNYIRTSHYPPAEEFIALCDSIGLFVELEAPMCWIGHGANATWRKENPHDLRFRSLIRQQAFETVAHYRNHPSIIIWSMANESAWGPIWEELLDDINLIDPTRPVSFHDQAYGGFNNHGSTNTQIANIHYPGPGGPAVAWKFDRPLLFGEYAHLNTYNRQEIVTDPGVRDAWGRGLESMWENMYYSKGCLGGAIWSGVDDVFYLPDGTAVGYGEWGPIDGWRRPKPEYWHLKKIYSPVKIVARKLDRPEIGKPIIVPIENRQLFSDINELTIKWTIGHQYGTATMNLAPGNSGLLHVWPGKEPAGGEVLDLSFVSPYGIELDHYRLPFQGSEQIQESLQKMLTPELHVLERKASVLMGDTEWVFDAPSGKLRSVDKLHNIIINGGPELFMVPLKTGPCNTEHSLHIEVLNEPCHNWKGTISGTGKENGIVYIDVEGSYDEADLKLRYNFDQTARVSIDYEIIPHADISPRQLGLVFSMPSEFNQLDWIREGQWTVYPENHIGRTKGTAIPFPKGMLASEDFGDKPVWTWEEETHSMGSNDFRATRDRLYQASLIDEDGHGIRMFSDGTGAFRAFLQNDNIYFLGASFSTAGGDLFFSSHLASERQPLKKGETRKGTLILGIL
ncbi:MAG: glycoside hydrolase family 2 [Bacteroidetes bacterium]|nr:glycoside hydrolase family 2 [Bacteroidota bacterium]MBT4400205.1 glycoside hydrolase family 2 [Bacteroidota bacterium]MBT4410833.1 glycoside hydrolase family 2 [Bacteroidota bacterium]MBT5425865.1 glycoside hydrolase family 2 [Bacteroidota bacterium]MBT7094928.1 glycoside hydrolase family 2 [Bacteroidota bacterium]